MIDFSKETERVCSRVKELKSESTAAFVLVADIHLAPSRPTEYYTTSIENIKAIGEKTGVDTLFHLGDTIGVCESTPGEAWQQVWVDATLRKDLTSFGSAMKNAYFVPGNHDGIFALPPNPKFWGPMMLPKESANVHVCPALLSYYVDDPAHKVRYVAFMSAYSDDAHTAYYGYPLSVIRWLAVEALNAPDGYAIFFFTHIAPCDVDAKNIKIGKSEMFSLVKAFREKSVFTMGDLTVDYAQSRAKLICFFVGHGHVDWICNDERFPCPVIEVATLLPHDPSGNPAWPMPADAFGRPRSDKDETLNCFDIVLFDTKTDHVDLIRFGAGEDRTLKG